MQAYAHLVNGFNLYVSFQSTVIPEWRNDGRLKSICNELHSLGTCSRDSRSRWQSLLCNPCQHSGQCQSHQCKKSEEGLWISSLVSFIYWAVSTQSLLFSFWMELLCKYFCFIEVPVRSLNIPTVFIQPDLMSKPGKSWTWFVWHLCFYYPMIPTIITKKWLVSFKSLFLHQDTNPENETS